MKAPRSALPTMVAAPTRRVEWPWSDPAPLLLLPVTSAPTAEVATVYTEPNLEVATPAPEAARVIASPPTLVTTVKACPPKARKKEKRDQTSF